MPRPVHPPVLLPADSEWDYVHPPERRIRPVGLAVAVWVTRLFVAAAIAVGVWEAFHVVPELWAAIADRAVPRIMTLLPWRTGAVLLATFAVLAVGWFAFGDQNEWPAETLRRVRQDPDAEHWAHQRV